MTGAWRRRLSAEDRAELDAWWSHESSKPPLTDLEIDEGMRRSALESRLAYDPEATLEEELQIRLQGSLDEGELPFDLGRELFKPLGESVNAASRSQIELSLSGILPGSTILRIRTSVAILGDDQNALLSAGSVSPSDQAIRKLLEVLESAEGEGDPRSWPAALRVKLPSLVDVLYGHNLTAEFTWLAGSGAVRRTRLTSRGQAFVRSLREYDETKHTERVQGQVTGLRQAGWVVVSPERGADMNIKISQNDLQSLRLTLWQEVEIEVEVAVRRNRAGDELGPTYKYVRALS